MYADDTVLLSPSPVALQQLIDLARAFFAANGLVINKDEETKCMAVRPDCSKRSTCSKFLHRMLLSQINKKKHEQLN